MIRKAIAAIAVVAAVCLPAVPAAAQTTPKFPIEDFKLKNGLRVILSEDHSIPVVAIALTYDVGARDEPKGRTGFAHLFEHMLFQGSANVKKGEHNSLIGAAGGMSNGFTRPEATTYIEMLPAEKLPLALWLEADRMRSLNVSAENLRNQQEVVKEEKRMRYDNQPYMAARVLRATELAFKNPANAHAPIGSMEDLDAANLEDVRKFFETYYVPNNATLVIVGDFKPADAKRLVREYFEGIPARPMPTRVDKTEPPRTAEVRDVFKDPLARLPALNVSWHAPSYGSPDVYPMAMLGEILFGSESSRANQELVKGRQIALAVQGGQDTYKGPSLFGVFAIHKPNVSAKEMEDAIVAEIEKIKQTPPSAEELERAKTRFLASRFRGSFFFGFENLLGRAVEIADYAVFMNDPNLINTEVEKYRAVTPEQIQAAARKYFRPETRTVLEIAPAPAAPMGPRGGAQR
jgi:predicted Zn-dependent peptidase